MLINNSTFLLLDVNSAVLNIHIISSSILENVSHRDKPGKSSALNSPVYSKVLV